MANSRDLELGWEGGIRGGTCRGHSGGPSSREENAVGPRPPGRRKTPIRGCPSSTRESPHRHGSADSHDLVFSISHPPPHDCALKAASGPCGSSSKREGLGQRIIGNASASGTTLFIVFPGLPDLCFSLYCMYLFAD